MKPLPSTEERFREIFAKGVSKRTCWVSQIEVEIISKWAKKQGLELVILNREPTEPLLVKRKRLYLLNVDECHYKYMVSNPVSEGKVKKARS
jgi:hypothetical protein